MQIQPILAALHRHRLASILIALEVALACAVLCNAFFLIVSRVQQTQVNSGVDENALAVLKLSGYDEAGGVDLNARVLSGLGKIPGVQSVSVINEVPFGDHVGTAGITTDADGKHFGGVVEFYLGGPGSFEALGLHLVAGSAPQAGDYQPVRNFVGDAGARRTSMAGCRSARQGILDREIPLPRGRCTGAPGASRRWRGRPEHD